MMPRRYALTDRIKKALAEQWQRKGTRRVVLYIPVPPSTNELTRNRTSEEIARAKAAGKPVRGRKRTDRYLTWLAGAGAMLNAQKPGKVAGPYTLSLIIPRGTKADLGNLEKAASDLLQAHGVIDNDRKAEWIVLGWSDHGGHEAMVIVSEGNSLADLNAIAIARNVQLPLIETEAA